MKKGWVVAQMAAALLLAQAPVETSAQCVNNCTFTGTTVFDEITVRKPWSDVRAFGAKGDGVADDTIPIQAAINFARTLQNVVYFPPGAYKITSRLKVPPNVDLEGVGVGFGSSIKPVSTDAITIVGADFQGGWGFKNRIRGLNIWMTNAQAFKAIHIDNAYTVKIEETQIFEAGSGGGITIHHANHVTLEDVVVTGQGTGVGVGISITDADVKIYNPDIEGFWDGLVVHGSRGAHVFGGYFERNNSYAIKFIGASFNTVIGARVATSNNSAIAIGFWAAGAVPSEQNTIIGSTLEGFGGIGTVFQDARSRDNTLINTYVNGGIMTGGNNLTVFAGKVESGRVLSVSKSLDFPAPSAVPGNVELTVPAPGAEPGDTVTAGFSLPVGGDYLLTAFVSGPNAVTFRWTQISGSASDPDGPGGALYRADIWKR